MSLVRPTLSRGCVCSAVSRGRTLWRPSTLGIEADFAGTTEPESKIVDLNQYRVRYAQLWCKAPPTASLSSASGRRPGIGPRPGPRHGTRSAGDVVALSARSRGETGARNALGRSQRRPGGDTPTGGGNHNRPFPNRRSPAILRDFPAGRGLRLAFRVRSAPAAICPPRCGHAAGRRQRRRITGHQLQLEDGDGERWRVPRGW